MSINKFKGFNLGTLRNLSPEVRHLIKQLNAQSQLIVHDLDNHLLINRNEYKELKALLERLEGMLINRNGKVKLTDDWNAGDYKIIAEQFESEAEDGTSPFIINSTTRVDNLNSDKLDDQDGSHYLDRSNHTGQQSVDTLSDHDKAVHDALNINADTLDGEEGSHYLDRSNHTGTQSLGTISGHDKAEHDALNINADTVDNYHASSLLSRSNHTGTQSLGTISGHDKSAHDVLNIDADTLDGLHANGFFQLPNPTTHYPAYNYSGQNLDSIKHTGFYNGDTMINAPASHWFYVLHVQHSHDNNYRIQIAWDLQSYKRMFIRHMQGGSWGSWYEYYKQGDDVNYGTAGFTGAVTVQDIQLRNSTHRDGVLEVLRKGTTAWSGFLLRFSSTALWSILANQTTFGFYDDHNSDWIIKYYANDKTVILYNGSSRLETTSTGVKIYGVIDHSWIEIDNTNLLNNWQSERFSGQKFGYMKDSNNFIHLKGSVGNNTPSGITGGLIYTLPTGYRPVRELFIAVNCADNIGNWYPARVQIQPDGDVLITMPNNAGRYHVFLDGAFGTLD